MNAKTKTPSDREAAEARVVETQSCRNADSRKGYAFERKNQRDIQEIRLHSDSRFGTIVGTTIDVVVSSLTKGLKSVDKGVGNGLQELGKKLDYILPDPLGSIVSFVFRTAGQVVSFLGKNAWLVILAVAAFLIEKVTKRNL